MAILTTDDGKLKVYLHSDGEFLLFEDDKGSLIEWPATEIDSLIRFLAGIEQ